MDKVEAAGLALARAREDEERRLDYLDALRARRAFIDNKAATLAFEETIHPMERDSFPKEVFLSMIRRGIELSRHPELLQEGGSQ